MNHTRARTRTLIRAFALVAAAAPLPLAGCNDAPTTALVENAYPDLPVYKVWWAPTLFESPIPPGAVSETERTIPGADFAYALLAPGWSLESASPPAQLIVVASGEKLSVAAHDLLRIVVSDAAFVGNCATGKTLSAEDAQLVVERIFPGEFSGSSYDPATCLSAPDRADAGVPADTGVPADAATAADAATD